jgi:hypothetical protein
MQKVNWLITDFNIVVNYEGQTHIVPRQDKLADELIAALKDKDYDAIPNLVSAAKRVEDFGDGHFTVEDGTVYIDGMKCPEALSRKIIQFANDELPYEPLVKFATNLLQNPSFRAVNELFQFLEENDCPLTQDGFIVCYKKVKSDFTDIYSGTFDNSVGNVVEMARNEVDENSEVLCSKGLHAANWEYANNFYSSDPKHIMLEIEINPADVVSIPKSYDGKMRVCKYKVLGVVDQKHSDNTFLRRTNKSDTKASSSYFNDEDNECLECGEYNDNGNDYCDDCDMGVNYCDECGNEDCIDFECIDQDCCEGCGDYDCYDQECLDC